MTNLTRNFTEREVTHWAENVRTMTDSDRKLAIELATFHVERQHWDNAKAIARHMQVIRDAANAHFGFKISLVATSWFRPIKWERHRNRNGSSQHTTGHAIDITVQSSQPARNQEVMRWIWETFEPNWEGGCAKLERNNVIVFIHFDLGANRRWEY